MVGLGGQIALAARRFAPITAAVLVLMGGAAQAQQDQRARVVSPREAVVAAEMAGRVAQIPVKEADSFRKGDVLAAFDCSEQAARLAAAEAVRAGSEKVLEARRRLAHLGSGTDLEMAMAEADMARARGDAQVARVLAARCDVRAPFDGRVVKRRINLGESAAIGTPLVEIIDDRTLEIEVLIPSRWLSWVKAGTPLVLAVDETGRRYDAKVVTIGVKIDPVSQSVPVRADVVGPRDGLVPGMSGAAQFRGPQN